MQGSATVGTITHEGVTSSSNHMTADEMRSSLGIADEPAVAEPETPADPAPDSPSSTQVSVPADQPVSEARQAKKKNPQERIDRITFEREEARRDAARVREESQAEIARVRAKFQAQIEALKPKETPQAKPQGDGLPKLEDFADQPDPYAAWMEAKFEHRLNTEFKTREDRAEQARKEQAQQQQQFAREQSERERLQTFGQKIAKAVEANPELQAAFEAAGDLPISRPMADALIESDAPERVMAYLASNSAECVEIASMGPLQAFRAITRLDARLEAAPGSAPVKPKSSAHAPISPVGGAHAAPASGPPDPKTCTPEEFDAYWNAQEKAASGRR